MMTPHATLRLQNVLQHVKKFHASSLSKCQWSTRTARAQRQKLTCIS